MGVAISFSRGLPDPGVEPTSPVSPALQADSLPTESSGKPIYIYTGEGNPLQYSCLENSMERGTWQATVHGATKSRIWLNDQHVHFPFFMVSFLSFFTLISISYLSKSHTSPESLLCLNSAPTTHIWASQVELVVKNPPANAGDLRDGD